MKRATWYFDFVSPFAYLQKAAVSYKSITVLQTQPDSSYADKQKVIQNQNTN